MFRPRRKNDITDYEFKNYIAPHFDLYNKYVFDFLIPDACAFYIFSAYNHHFEESSLDILIKTALEAFNTICENDELKLLKDRTKYILKIKYGLKITNENPIKVIDTFPKLTTG